MKMYLTVVSLSALLCSIFSYADDIPETHEQKIVEARTHAQALGGALKSRLQQAIANGGFEAGVNECYIAAGPIAKQLSQNGWQVGRTALKVRNPENQPDEWETMQLHKFADALSKQQPMPIEASDWNEQKGEFRYMSAIVTQPLCTGCHGNNVAPDIEKVIKQRYPEDRATGFEVGSLRGAFTLTYSEPDDNTSK